MNKNKQAVEVYDKIASTYNQMYFDDKADFPYIDELLKRLTPNSRILDIGCGVGHFSKYIANKGFRVEGIDLSKKMLEIAKVKVPEVKFKIMDMTKLEYPDNTFDSLICTYALTHIPTENIASTLKGFKRILKPNGYVFIAVQKGEADKFVEEPLNNNEKIFLNLFTKERLKNLIEAGGFTVEYEKEVSAVAEADLSSTLIYIIGRK